MRINNITPYSTLSCTTVDTDKNLLLHKSEIDYNEISIIQEYDADTSVLWLKSGVGFFIDTPFIVVMEAWQKYKKLKYDIANRVGV